MRKTCIIDNCVVYAKEILAQYNKIYFIGEIPE